MPSGIFTLRQLDQALAQGAWTAAPNYAGTFDGSTQYIVTPSSSNLSMGTGDFTIECWCFPSVQEVRGLFQTSPSAGLPGVQSGIGVYFTTSLGAWNLYLAGSNYTPTGLTLANQWTHIAITRSGTTSRFFVNGVLAQTVAGDTTNYTDTYFVIGGFLSTVYLWRGQISNFRVIKGAALYTAAFTPPENALTAVSGTQLLTLQNPTIVDNSANNFSLTNTGTVTTSLQYPFSTIKPLAVDYLVVAGGGGGGGNGGAGGGAGGLLQGNLPVATGSAITVTVGGGGSGGSNPGASGSNSVFGSITSIGGGGGAFGANPSGAGVAGGSGGGGSAYNGLPLPGGQGVSGQGNKGGDAVPTGAGQFASAGGGGAGTAGVQAPTTALGGNGGVGAASNISGTRTAYAGGGGGGGNTFPTNYGIGGTGGGGGSAGTNGSASTGGGASAGGTGGSGIVIISYPDTYAAPASTTGSPVVSTSGSGSILFNGSAQWITYASNAAWTLGSTFTIEAWVYPTALSVNTKRICQSDAGFDFNVSNSGNVGFNAASTTSTISLNTWTHIAVVCNSGTVSIYFNGTSQTLSGTSTGVNVSGTSTLTVGTYQVNSGFVWQGNISNFRIVKGSAVYTSNFTPSTAPLRAITNTQLLLNSVSGAYLADSSANSFAPSSNTLAPTWSQLSPFVTGLGYKNRVYTWTSSGSITF